jgi:pyruvate dehydrogenase E1 component alpha subunit
VVAGRVTKFEKGVYEMKRMELWSLYGQMFRSRLFEEAVIQLWEEGRISGEMHLGIGEEAIAAGITDHLEDGDAMAVCHRGTPPFVMLGVDTVLLLKEFLGREDGLCHGWGGHMHLFSPRHLAASSGIVGAAGPIATGFALAGRRLRPGTVAAAFFGDGALNQGMLLESMNLAAAWKLPVIFVCKDNGKAITTLTASVTSGNPMDRAKGFGIPALAVDGMDVEAVWEAAGEAVERGRSGNGPTFLHARCNRPEGHFLGDPLLRTARRPVREMGKMAGPLVRSFVKRKGASLKKRVNGMRTITSLITQTVKDRISKPPDPLALTRKKLLGDEGRLKGLEASITDEIQQTVAAALASDTDDQRSGS